MKETLTSFSSRVLDIDCDQVAADMEGAIRDIVLRRLRRKGAVVGLSGGIDSSVTAAICARALGKDRVFGVMMPENESSDDSLEFARLVAKAFGISTVVENIGPTLEALGCYRRRDDAIRKMIPEYGEGWKSKIVISGGLEGRINHFRLVAEAPTGARREARLELPEYLQIVAATNFKQRVRKTLEYFHADRLNYAVVGTPNRLEYDQGFFVKNGDGAADVKPIAHLYKTQVYALARHLGLPEAICNARPTTDTYSMPQGQDEFYFGIPYEQMDLALWAYNHRVPAGDLALGLRITERAARDIYRDIESKRRSTRYLHQRPILIEDIEGGD